MPININWKGEKSFHEYLKGNGISRLLKIVWGVYPMDQCDTKPVSDHDLIYF